MITKMFGAGLCVVALASVASADFAYNIRAPEARNAFRDAADATLADFQAADAALDASTVVFLADPDVIGGGNGGGWNNMNDANNFTLDGFTLSNGSATGNGWNSGNAPTDTDPIMEGYAFGVGMETVTIGNLLANTSAGDTLVLTMYGAGDTASQISDFTATYGGTTTATVSSAFANAAGAAVQFSFVADGVTDDISFLIGGSGILNGFSFSVTEAAIPEPASAALALIGCVGLGFRRRRS